MERFATIVCLALAAASARAAGPSGDVLAPAIGAAQRDLDAGLRDLAELRERIAAEKIPLVREVGRLESELAEVRRDLDETTRASDTRALETSQLEGAVKLRREEMTYVSNLMDEFARGFESSIHPVESQRYAPILAAAKQAPQDRDLSMAERFDRQTNLLAASLARLEDQIGGTRFPGEVVDPAGRVAKGTVAMAGPAVVFAAAGGVSGVVVAQAGSALPALKLLEAPIGAGIADLVERGEGTLPFDPTRGGALQALVAKGSLVHYFKKGGPIMWPLLFVSILATSVIFERLVFLARTRSKRGAAVVESIFAHVERGEVEGAIRAGRGSEDFVARALTYALEHRQKSLSDALIRAVGQELVRFTRGISVLDTCVTLAPLLGLLGTVTGMMGSFGMLGGAELSAPAQITGGIAEALIATAFGLGIAVTALIPMNYLHNKSDAARHELEDASTHLEILMKPILDLERTESPAPGITARAV